MLAGGSFGSGTGRARRHAVAEGARALGVVGLGLGLGLGLVACGDGGGSDDGAPLETSAAETTAGTGLPSCRDVQRTVVLGVFGAATAEAGDAARWVDDPDAEPAARPEVAAIATAYRDAGYELLYVTLLPAESRIGDRPLVDAITVWLGLNGFPVGEGAGVWAPPGDGSGDPSVALIEELARRGIAGTVLDAAYAGDRATVFPLLSGGIPHERMYMVGAREGEVPADTEVSSRPLPEEDLADHVAQLQDLAPICR